MTRTAILALCLAAGPAIAGEQVCAERLEIVGLLADSYGETEIMRGIASSGTLLQFFVSPKGTWSIVTVEPTDTGTACISGTGTNFMAFASTLERLSAN